MALVGQFLPQAFAWVTDGMAPWPESSVQLRLCLTAGIRKQHPQFAADITAKDMIESWNPFMGNLTLTATPDSSVGTPILGDGVNDVYFSGTVQGAAFPEGVRAVTLVRVANGARTEADIVVNPSFVQADSSGGVIISGDTLAQSAPQSSITYFWASGVLERLLRRETGHLLGLGDPDVAGQTVVACMNKSSTDVYRQTDDDQSGIASLYGEGPKTHLPEILYTQPSVELEPGENQTLWVGALYYASLQWYKDGVPIQGANTDSLSLSGAKPEDEGVYTLRAYNAWKSVTSAPIVVKVYSTPQVPRILFMTSGGTLKEGQGVSLEVTCRSGSKVQYQWYKNGAAIVGATTSQLYIADALPSDAGTYRVDLTNAVGTRSSPDIALRIDLPPLPTIPDIPSSVLSLERGKPSGIRINVTAVHATYVWYKDGVALAAPAPVTPAFTIRESWMEPSCNLSFPQVSPTDEGSYRLELTNRAGTTVGKPIAIAVMASKTRTLTQLPEEVRINPGKRLSLSASNFHYTTDTCQWFHDGKPIPNDSPWLSIARCTPSDAGTYEVVVVSDSGIARSSSCRVLLGTHNVQERSALVGGVLYVVSADGLSIERFNAADGSLLPSIPAPPKSVIARISVGDSGVCACLEEGSLLYYRFSDATWTGLPGHSATFAGTFTSTKDSLYVIEASSYYGLTSVNINSFSLPSGSYLPTGPTGKLPENWTPLSIRQSGDGNHLRGIFSVTTAQGISYSMLSVPTGEPKAVPLTGDFVAERTSCAWERSDGRTLVTDGGAVYDAASLRLLRRLDRPVEHLVSAGAAGDLLLSQGSILSLDTDGGVAAWAPAPAGAELLVPNGDTLRVLVRDAAGSGRLVPFPTGSLQKGQPPGTGPLATTASVPVCDVNGTFVGKDGQLNLLDCAGARLLTWSPAERTLARVLPLRAQPRDFWHDAANNLLYLAYEGGLVSRLSLTADSGEQVLLHVPGEIRSVCAGGGRVLVWADDATPDGSICSSLHAHDAGTGTRLGSSPLGWGIRATSLPLRYSCDPSGASLYFLDSSSQPRIQRYSADARGLANLDSAAAVFSEQDFGPYASTREGMVFRPSPQAGQLLASVSMDRDSSYLDFGLDRLSQGAFILNPVTLDVIARIPDRDVVDALWLEVPPSRLCLLSNAGGGARLGLYSPGFDKEEAFLTLDCVPRNVSKLADGSLVVVGMRAGVPRLFQVASDLSRVLWEGNLGTPQRLANMSIQADVGSGDDILVPGFVVAGPAPKTMLIRAVGPGLQTFKVSGVLPDPSLTLYDGKGSSVTSNSGWTNATNVESVRVRSAQAGAFALAASSPDSVLLRTLPSGSFTAEARGISGGGGRALVELYDLDEGGGEAHIVNMSARCKVTPTSVAIGGFVVQGTKPVKMLLRAAGPKLADYKVQGVLADPKLTLFSGQTVVTQNDNWSDDSARKTALKAAFTATGAFAFEDGSKDAALLVELPPGNYTVWGESADSGSGVVLLELYLVD